MKAKAALFVILLALVIENGDTWGWVKRIWHGAKRIWRRHSWIRRAVYHGLRHFGDLKKLRELDDESYEELMARLEEDIASDFDDDQASDFLNGLDEIRKLSDDEFKNLEDLSSEHTPVEQRDVADSDVLKALSRQLKDQD